MGHNITQASFLQTALPNHHTDRTPDIKIADLMHTWHLLNWRLMHPKCILQMPLEAMAAGDAAQSLSELIHRELMVGSQQLCTHAGALDGKRVLGAVHSHFVASVVALA